MERRSPAQEVGRERDSAASSWASQLPHDHPRAVPGLLYPRPLRGVRAPRCPLGAGLSPSRPRWSHHRGRSAAVASRERPGGDSSSETGRLLGQAAPESSKTVVLSPTSRGNSRNVAATQRAEVLPLFPYETDSFGPPGWRGADHPTSPVVRDRRRDRQGGPQARPRRCGSTPCPKTLRSASPDGGWGLGTQRGELPYLRQG